MSFAVYGAQSAYSVRDPTLSVTILARLPAGNEPQWRYETRSSAPTDFIQMIQHVGRILIHPRSRKLAVPAASPISAPATDDIMQVKVWLLGISPMVWRRVLVSATFSLRELHGVLQVAMGWEAIHLYQFSLHAVRYGSSELSASSPDIILGALRVCA